MHARKLYDLSTRKQLCAQIRKMGKIPIIIQRDSSQHATLRPLQKHVYGIPTDTTWQQLQAYVRKLIDQEQNTSLAKSEGLCLFCEKEIQVPKDDDDKENGGSGKYKLEMIAGSSLVQTIYKQYHQSDGFIFAVYSKEHVFG